MEKIIVQKLHEIEEKESPPPMLFSELVEAELPDGVRTEVEDLLKIKISKKRKNNQKTTNNYYVYFY